MATQAYRVVNDDRKVDHHKQAGREEGICVLEDYCATRESEVVRHKNYHNQTQVEALGLPAAAAPQGRRALVYIIYLHIECAPARTGLHRGRRVSGNVSLVPDGDSSGSFPYLLLDCEVQNHQAHDHEHVEGHCANKQLRQQGEV